MEELTKSERIEKGQIFARTIIEMLGSPKEHLTDTMEQFLEKLEEDPELDVIKKKISDANPHEMEEGSKIPGLKKEINLFSAYTELEIWFKNIDKLFSFCFDTLPSSIEILEPSTLQFENRNLSELLNDLQGKLHHLDYALKDHIAARNVVGKQMNMLIQNFINFAIEQGKTKPEEVGEIIGIEPDKAKDLMDQIQAFKEKQKEEGKE